MTVDEQVLSIEELAKALTKKQKAFADHYIITGNATDAAKKAGYSEKTAHVIGAENLTKPKISQYLNARCQPLKGKEEAVVATGNEVLAFFTDTMRGKIKDQFGLDPSLSDRLKAAIELNKRLNATKGGNGMSMSLIVTPVYGTPDEDEDDEETDE